MFLNVATEVNGFFILQLNNLLFWSWVIGKPSVAQLVEKHSAFYRGFVGVFAGVGHLSIRYT